MGKRATGVGEQLSVQPKELLEGKDNGITSSHGTPSGRKVTVQNINKVCECEEGQLNLLQLLLTWP